MGGGCGSACSGSSRVGIKVGAKNGGGWGLHMAASLDHSLRA